MPYTNVWNNSTPTGAEAANTIDDIFRTVKVDISDRLNDIFGGMPSFTTDPLRPYGLKFTDAQDAVINFGDNAGTPRQLIIKNKANSTTLLTIGSTGTITSNGGLIVGINSAIGWSTRSFLQSASDGNILLTNNAATSFNLLQLGGTTASFPALKRNTTTIEVRLADDTNFANIKAATFVAGATTAMSTTQTLLQIIGGATSSAFRNAANNADNLLISDAGAVTVRAGLTVSSIGITVTSGGIVISASGLSVSGGATVDTLTSTSSITAGSASNILWTGRSTISSPADGSFLLRNNAGTDFTFLQLGGTTSSFPGFTKVGTTIFAKLADGSDYTRIGCKTVQFIDATANFQFSKQVQVSVTGTTAICAFNGAGIGIVKGTSGGNQFTDLVTIGGGVVTVLAANTNLGAPAARTYTATGNTLNLAMASGTYLVDPIGLS